MKAAQNIIFSGTLDAASIDKVSEMIAELMEPMKASSKEIMSMRLSAETVMGIWAEELGENTACQLISTGRFGKTALVLQSDGKAVDPTQYQDVLLLSVSNNPNMVSALGLPAEYRYRGGRNELKLRLPTKKASPIRHVLIAIIASVVFGVCLRRIIPDAASVLAQQLLTPLINTITKLLCLIAGPLVFMSIVSGITGVDDAASFGKIGGTLVKRFLLINFIVAVLVWLSLCWMFPLSLSGGAKGESAFLRLIEMILDIVPKDIVSPFQTGNALQIIFIAICLGLACIVSGDTVLETVTLVNQINSIVQLIMSVISKLLPTLIFLSVSNLIITSNISELSQIVIPLILITVICLLLPLVYGVFASVRTGMPLIRLLRSQYPSFLMALSTASSSAVFSTNVECCIEDLGIDEKLAKFGVPFGQVLYKPAAVVVFIILSLYYAKQYQIQITPSWILTMVIVSTILSVAMPPIPGGIFSAVLILFSQLGIPASCMALCATILTVIDYPGTASNIVNLQQVLLVSAKKLNMIKKDLSSGTVPNDTFSSDKL